MSVLSNVRVCVYVGVWLCWIMYVYVCMWLLHWRRPVREDDVCVCVYEGVWLCWVTYVYVGVWLCSVFLSTIHGGELLCMFMCVCVCVCACVCTYCMCVYVCVLWHRSTQNKKNIGSHRHLRRRRHVHYQRWCSGGQVLFSFSPFPFFFLTPTLMLRRPGPFPCQPLEPKP